MSDNAQTESWGTSSWGDAAEPHAPAPSPDRPLPVEDPARHAVLPAEQPTAEQQTSYGTFFEHPPYATENSPMRVDVPDTTPRPMPQPAPAPMPAAPVAPTPTSTAAQETVTCPECGNTQYVNLNRRDATDFCRRCDFPLFWVPARITRDWNPTSSTESLRRLPGTGGATRLASLACPHCAERNPATADTCARCGRSMHLEQAPPPPAPVYIPPPPEPVFVPEPERGIAWWIWTLIGTAAVALVFLVLYLTDVITF